MSGSEYGPVTERLAVALDRIAAENHRLNIVTSLAVEDAHRHHPGGAPGPLDGLILGIKDNIAVANMPWTAGLGYWRERIAEADATVVARLRSAGTTPLAMVNMDEGALGATTDNPHFGRTGNPLDPNLTPGGSSGGSAAAIAAGFADAALGSDTMGSIRIPAAYCGVAGLKPTRGLVPRHGMTHLSPTLDTIGPLARDVTTLVELIIAMAGADNQDPASLPAPSGWRRKFHGSVTGILRVGLPRQIGTVDCECEVLEGLDTARSRIEAIGCQVIDVDLHGWSPGRARRGGLLICEVEGAVELADALATKLQTDVSDELRSMLDYGRAMPGNQLADGYARIRTAATAAERAFAECDVLLMPTAPQRAFSHDHPAPENQADFTSLANFHGGPALALPVPVSDLPASIQLMGQHFSEPLILALGARLERALRD